MVDAATDAASGIDVRAEEDSAALVAAFEDDKLTTGEAPLALLFDNRPSKHTPERPARTHRDFIEKTGGDTVAPIAVPGECFIDIVLCQPSNL